MQKTT